jgi:hypothetical protein
MPVASPAGGSKTLRIFRIEDKFIGLEADEAAVSTTRFTKHAAADGEGVWFVSNRLLRAFHRNQAITLLTLAERLLPPSVDVDHRIDALFDGSRATDLCNSWRAFCEDAQTDTSTSSVHTLTQQI